MTPEEMRRDAEILISSNDGDVPTGWVMVAAAEICERQDTIIELLQDIRNWGTGQQLPPSDGGRG